ILGRMHERPWAIAETQDFRAEDIAELGGMPHCKSRRAVKIARGLHQRMISNLGRSHEADSVPQTMEGRHSERSRRRAPMRRTLRRGFESALSRSRLGRSARATFQCEASRTASCWIR